MRHAADLSQPAIVETLQAGGWKVRVTSQVGGSFPDIVALSPQRRLYLIEAKTGKGKQSEGQIKFADEWPVVVLRDVDSTLKFMRQEARA